MAVAVESQAPAQAALGSALASVVVYAQGAICTRRARFTLPEGHRGEFRIHVGDVPLSAYPQSLRGSVAAGPDGLRVADVRPRIEAVVVAPRDVPELRRALDAAEEHVRRLTARRTRLAAEIDATAGLRATQARQRKEEPYPRPAAVESVLALADFVTERLDTLQTRMRTLDEECRQAEHDAHVARHRLDEASGSLRVEEARTTGSAVLTLDLAGDATDGPAEVVVDLEYQVPGARWVPQYQLRLDTAMTGGTLVMRAAVAQRTGEDWTGVRLALSTADLDRRTDLPELRSLRIGRRQAAPAPSGWREPPSGLDELFAGYDAGVVKRREREAAHTRYAPVPVSAGATLTGGMASAAAGGYDTAELRADQMAWMDQEQARGGYGQAAPMPPPMVMPPSPIAPGSAPAAPAPPPPSAPRMRRSRGAAPGGPPHAEALAAPPPAQPSFAGAPYGGGGAHFDEDDGYARLAADAPDAAGPGLPGADLLDYAGLELTGADDEASRGRLRPGGSYDPVAEEYRRRAETVASLALPTHAARVRESAGSYDYRFDVAAAADVESDGGWHTVPVCTVAVGLEPEFVTVPSVDEAVYGTVHVTNASAHALLAGPADVSVGGEFLMTVPLPTLAPGERQRVGVGVVESVQVARRTHMRESTAGLRNQTSVLDHRIEIDVANHLAREITVEVLERVPVSDDKDVKIEEHAADPQWERDTELRDGRLVRGARVWRLRLLANSTRTLVGRYEIRIPGGKSVVGGNRRA
ncbi:mucoidy inhibitor MuiA family protein [Yinghuangia sp. YIM S09857]|uniref:mucoidy inhibitor MuiA family protein n=1 Tax=Yinghuangia sp. YIM S09857 TaxID=3436929 RepID=UPI003F534731